MRDDDGPAMLNYRSLDAGEKQTWADELGLNLLRLGRRLTFALGVGLLCGGLAFALSPRNHDAATMMGWGGGLIGLFIPLTRLGVR